MAARACERARERAHERREEDRGTVSWRGTPVREWEEARGVGRLENHSLQQLERTSLHSVLPWVRATLRGVLRRDDQLMTGGSVSVLHAHGRQSELSSGAGAGHRFRFSVRWRGDPQQAVSAHRQDPHARPGIF